MEIIEIERDIFLMPRKYYLAHCVSSDYALGAGIAKTFNQLFNMRNKLKTIYPVSENNESEYIGKSLIVDNVFNLVTKKRYFDKPTYKSMMQALRDMARQCKELDIRFLTMPQIGCGLDRLKWDKVKEQIQEAFSDNEITIVICNFS